jgi:predicted peptidase
MTQKHHIPTSAFFLILTLTASATNNKLDTLTQILPGNQHAAATFMLQHMPESDHQALTPEFLAEHITYAYRARETFPWAGDIPENIFLNDVLPYANLDEHRDAWRKPLFERFGKLVEDCTSAGEAAIKLNTTIFKELNVKYSRERSKPSRSALEVMQEGKASCTGLSILLVSACRAVGIPARVVGTPVWVDGGGNHTWVEIWDNGWHSIGAAESQALNRTWFTQRASQQIADNPKHAIYATSFQQTDTHFPLVWAPRNRSVYAVNVTDTYAINEATTATRTTIEEVLAGQTLAGLLAKPETAGMLIQANDLAQLTAQIWQKYVQEITSNAQRQAEQAEKSITYDGLTMRYHYEVIGEKPATGYPLYIALHGGGEAPARVNDSQWEHMQVYYLAGVTNGIYLAPRGITDNWNLHWREQSFACYDRLIENMIAFGQVDPNRVYLMGFSAGGDALYQIPARMPDRWAAAAMSAGHPNGVPPDNYANLGFLIQVGENDRAHKRNTVAAEYGVKLAALQLAHPDHYKHATYIHAGRGHNFLDHGPAGSRQRVFTDPAAWQEQGSNAPTEEVDSNSIRWLDQHIRNPLPRKLIWDVKTNATRSGEKDPGFWPTTQKANLHHWIGIDRYDKDPALEAERIVVEYAPDTQTIKVHEIGNFVRFYLHPTLFKPGEAVTVQVKAHTLKATPKLSLRTLVQTVLDRGDPHYIFPASLTLSRNPEGNWMLE